ncbi:MAG TPA: hypothetical protein VIF15_11755, partial [Polyangiaceae bacterium]
MHGAKTLPASLEAGRGWGVEPGGGVRAVVAGVRVVSWADGSIVAAADRLAAVPSSVIALPERMGGGFLFALGTHLWRADTWLGHARPVFTGAAPIGQVLLGLDRVYVRSQQGAIIAVDPRTGATIDLGPLPGSPNLGRLAALDGWRAVAIADLRGALVTLDAGSTWRPLALPIEPSDVVALDDALTVGGLDESRQMQWWEVRPDGQTGRLAVAPSAPSVDVEHATGALDSTARVFGPRPLAAAIEDGWPLVDGTAIVARDGALARVRLSDGALAETIADAFPLKPARCHPLPLARPRDPGAFGFVCGEPRGRTVVYRFSPTEARLVELRRFELPREVLASGNGALAVRGPCASDAADDPRSGDQAYCLMSAGGGWSEMHFRGDDVERARLVVLSDGRVALVRPPRAADLSTARLTLTDGTHSSHVPIELPPLRADVTRALRLGVWMDGFEERRPGVLGGWIDAAGSVVGVEIATDGKATVGEHIHLGGESFVSGRWGLGWTSSRRGLETTDGGMTWKAFDVPDTIASGRSVHARACGPVGCLAAGWMRVGWGAPEPTPSVDPPPHATPTAHAPPSLDLPCEPLSGKPPDPKPAPAGRGATRPAPSAPVARPWSGTFPGATWNTVAEFPPFSGRAGPAIPAGDAGIFVEASAGLERSLRSMPLARIHTWGPKSGEWDQEGRWLVSWQWPWGGWPDARSSLVTSTPWTTVDAARRALGSVPGTSPTVWTLAASDDADHALLIARHTVGTVTADLLALETDRAPVEVRRPGGDAFADVEGAARIAGRWYVATMQSAGELAASVVWAIDGGVAREIARVPRVGFEARPALHIARRTDGRALGLVVDGQPDAERGTTMRWVVGVDLDSGAVGDPEPLAPVDLSGRTVTACAGDDAGWQVDLPYPGTIRVRSAPAWSAVLQSPVARLRLSRERACVERVLGSVDGY